jgi:hypothetical protein
MALAIVASSVEREIIFGKVFLGRFWALSFAAIGLLAMFGL